MHAGGTGVGCALKPTDPSRRLGALRASQRERQSGDMRKGAAQVAEDYIENTLLRHATLQLYDIRTPLHRAGPRVEPAAA